MVGTFRESAFLLSWVLAFGLIQASCSRRGIDGHDDPAGVGSVGVALTVAPGVSLDSASFIITGPAVNRVGTVDVSQSATLSFQVGGLPAGAGYNVTIGATLSDGVTTCTGSADFAVAARNVTMVSVHVRCREPGRTGGVI